MPRKSPSKSAKTKTSSLNFKTIGYLRVSTGDQELEKNKSDILHLANDLNSGKVNFVEEIVSGKVSWKRRKIAEIIADFKKGDTLVVSELSRLGRSMLECMEILSVRLKKECVFMRSRGIGRSTVLSRAKSWRWRFQWHRKLNVI